MKYLRRTLRIFFSLAVLILIYLSLTSIFVPKLANGTKPMIYFYEQPENTIDVLFMGTCNTGLHLDTEIFWNHYGISSYMLWAPHQPFWNTYYYLLEALKTQNPKLVVLDVFSASLLDDYSLSRHKVASLGGMKQGDNWFHAVLDSTKNPKDKAEYLLGLPLYHARYAELTEEDYWPIMKDSDMVFFKGDNPQLEIERTEVIDASGMQEIRSLNSKEETYLRKIIELCAEKNISLVLVKTPCGRSFSESLVPYVNSVALIAEEYGIPFINYLVDPNTIDLAPEDFANVKHVNMRGARKVSEHLGQYIKANYELEDHRGDPVYSSWDENAKRIQKTFLSMDISNSEYLSEAIRDGYSLVVLQYEGSNTASNEVLNLKHDMMEAGINAESFDGDGYGALLCFPGETLSCESFYQGGMLATYENDGLRLYADFYNGITAEYQGKQVISHLDGRGFYFVMIDTDKREIVDISAFLQNNNYIRERLEH